MATLELLEYIDELKKYALDNDVRPMFTTFIDNKGRTYFMGTDRLNSSDRLKILGNAFNAMAGIVMEEKKGLVNATPLDMSKLKPLK